MKLLVVDDEAPARQWLRHLIEEAGPPYDIIGEAATGGEALELCKTGQVDVVLMDIRMPGMGGLEAAGFIAQMTDPPAVIFVSAFEEHALQAFDKHAVDYVLKPVRAERLLRSLARARNLSRVQLHALEELQTGADPRRPHLCAHFRGSLQRIPVEDVIYFRADSKYVVARHKLGESLLEGSLKSFEQEFGDRFIRIHRNALVSLACLSGIEKDRSGRARVKLQGCDDSLEISRRHLPAVRRWLKFGEV